MKFRHWKVRDMKDRKAYFVPVVNKPGGPSVLEQVAMFMREHAIAPQQCRIIENSSRHLNMSYEEFVLDQLAIKKHR